MSPGGLLFVGHAERIESLRPRFQFVADPHTFALCARDPKQPSAPRSESPQDLATTRPLETPAAAREAKHQRDGAVREGPPTPGRTSARRRQAVALGHGRRTESPHGDRSSPTESQLRPEGLPTLREARALADNGDLDEALRVTEAVIETQTPDAEAFGLLGSVHLAKGNLPLAREALVKSLYLDAQREETLLQLSLVYQRLGNRSQAARYRRRAAQAHYGGRSEQQR
jgi:Flp pilus assembly protein TadD